MQHLVNCKPLSLLSLRQVHGSKKWCHLGIFPLKSREEGLSVPIILGHLFSKATWALWVCLPTPLENSG
jgi:hypothetical protein